MPPDGVGLVSRDPELIADVRRLCAAAGQDLRVVAAPAEVAPLLRRLGVLLVDAASPDITATSAARDATASDGAAVIVLTTSPGSLDPWRTAVQVGARQVLTMPDDSRRLLDALALARESPEANGPLIGVVAGSGGVGASTLAAALAWAAGANGARATLVDLDPLCGGADLLLGLERAAGLRWPDLTGASGVVPSAALHDRLPRSVSAAVVSCGRLARDGGAASTDPPAAAATAVVAASRRGHGAAVVDLPRWRTDAAEAVLGACDVVLAVVSADVRGVASAAASVGNVASWCDDIHVIVRSRSHSRLSAEQIGDCLGRPVAGTLATDARLAAASDRGEFVTAISRSQVGSTAKALWGRFGSQLAATTAAG